MKCAEREGHMNKRIVFMGTASFSKEVLEMLIKENYNIVGVVTQPDRPVGRKKILTPSDVKKVALEHNIPVVQPERIKKDYQGVLDLKPDLIITAAYGQIVPTAVLDAPELGCINVHASLLPRHRGGAPVHRAIIENDEKTGVTIMYMAEKMDAGDIISQSETPISDEDTVGILYDRLAVMGAELLKETLPSILEGTNKRIPQDPELVTISPIISREDERLDWNHSTRDIFNKVRGLNPWPGCFTTYQGTRVKLWSGKIHQCENAMKHHGQEDNGTIVKIFKDAIGVKAEDGIYLITELQVAGKKRMSVQDYLNGKSIFEVGQKFE